MTNTPGGAANRLTTGWSEERFDDLVAERGGSDLERARSTDAAGVGPDRRIFAR